MQRKQYCVYNQTNECFLSLGATLGDRPLARFKQWLGFGSHHTDEGQWIHPRGGLQTLGFFAPRDLLYLDGSHRVVHILESFPALRGVPMHSDASSLLALPVHTISSSQTQPGNQVLICSPQEMESRLRSLMQPPVEQQAARQAARQCDTPYNFAAQRSSYRASASVAYFGEGGKLAVHAIRDLNASGLYLVTRDRWAIGTEVKMSLQPSGRFDEKSSSPVVIRMRVSRWGLDGVGLEFAGAAAEATELTSLYVC